MSKRNTNLNKEPFEGFVRHWRFLWVPCDDKGAAAPRPLKLRKWVQTETRTKSVPPRHPHVLPVTDLSIVPGGRLPAPVAMEPTPAAAAAVEQQLQQLVGAAGAAPPDAAAAPAPATSVSASLELELPPGSTPSAAGAAAAGAGASLAAPSPSGAIGPLSLAYSQQPSIGQPPLPPQLQLGHGGGSGRATSDGLGGYPSAAAAPSAATASERTDSDALGRLPHAGGAAASDYTDSMDIDAMGASQRTPAGRFVGGPAGSIDTAGADTAEGGRDDDGGEGELELPDDEAEEDEEEEDDDGLLGAGDDDDDGMALDEQAGGDDDGDDEDGEDEEGEEGLDGDDGLGLGDMP